MIFTKFPADSLRSILLEQSTPENLGFSWVIIDAKRRKRWWS